MSNILSEREISNLLSALSTDSQNLAESEVFFSDESSISADTAGGKLSNGELQELMKSVSPTEYSSGVFADVQRFINACCEERTADSTIDSVIADVRKYVQNAIEKQRKQKQEAELELSRKRFVDSGKVLKTAIDLLFSHNNPIIISILGKHITFLAGNFNPSAIKEYNIAEEISVENIRHLIASIDELIEYPAENIKESSYASSSFIAVCLSDNGSH